jgi:hypothetical protein
MTTVRIPSDAPTRLERIARNQGVPNIESPADIQAIMDEITNLATAKIAIGRLLVSLLALRAHVRKLEKGRV